MSTEDSHIWPVLFLGFSPNKYGGKNAQFPKMNLTNTGTQTWSAFSLASHFSNTNTNTQSFNLSTICDQLNNMWFILKYCKHANF